MNRSIPSYPLLWAVLVGCALQVACPTLAADAQPSKKTKQNPENKVGGDDREAIAPITIVDPPIHFMTKNGKDLVAVPKLSFEEFQEIYKTATGLKELERPPRYSIQQITIDGEAKRDRAILDVEIRVTTHDANWVRIPLGLDHAHLDEPHHYEGPGVEHLDPEPNEAGYVFWISSPANKQHTLRLKLVHSLVQVGPESRLELILPRSSHSRLVLRVPTPHADVSVSERALLETTEPVNGGGTEIKVADIGGLFRLSWRERRAEVSTNSMVLEATGNILVHVLGPGNITTEARLQLRTFGKPVDKIHVRLPPDARLLPANQPGYRAEPLSQDSAPQRSEQGQIVEIKFDERSPNPPEVRLTTEIARENVPRYEFVEVAGFNVLDAIRQSGFVALYAESDTNPVCNIDPFSARRVNEIPDSLHQDSVLAGFKYFRQPFSLKIRAETRRSRVSLEPRYVIEVGTKQIRLHGQLNVTIRGGKASFLDVAMNGWEIEEVGPENLVNREALILENTSSLIIPLKQAVTGELEITIRAVKNLVPNTSRLSFLLPRPSATALRPATIAVIPDDNVKLVPRIGEMQDLLLDPAPPLSEDIPKRRQRPFFFRERTESTKSQFVAEIEAYRQSIVVAMQSSVVFRENMIHVEQQLDYQIHHEPVHQLPLKLPQSLTENRSWEVQLDGQRVNHYPSRGTTNPELNDGTAEIYVALPTMQTGECHLSIRYAITSDLGSDQSAAIPFVLPNLGNITEHQLNLKASPPISLIPNDDRWARREDSLVNARPIQLTNDGTASSLDVEIGYVASDEGGNTVVNTAWVQTWLDKNSRQDRATFRISTNEVNVRINMPPSVDLGKLQIRVDGENTNVNAQSQTVTINLPTDSNVQSTHLIELWYAFPQDRPPLGTMHIDVPRIESALWTKQSYWQLITPRDEYLWAGPSGLTPEYHWSWNTLFGKRAHRLSHQLEQHLDASWRNDIPNHSWGTNQYQFSSLVELRSVQVCTISQKTALMVFGTFTSIAGLALIYVPALRHPVLLLCVGVIIVIGGFWYPQAAVIASQAGLLGLVLVFMGRFIQWFLLWRKRHEGIAYGTTGSSVERLNPDILRQLSDEGRLVPTATSPTTDPNSQHEL